ncbi:hypothetical protein GOY07_01640 [Wolbachia endosymbiont of Litomosoides sigmodontis]|uniref:hypothetical protein n=1 Tax=Wolbachia endosymbiont of Litomosoides sigmodontis TaxID=80850 RepID=UPI00158C32AB|nr:hypothetical protein [Wolbachia endosymbiont of Litomosoides sigmodontis]QKX02915.1 hypothetical protein GOY07_01640 [Wolbachia endosymbiont of Litomosoides sigmodontis]
MKNIFKKTSAPYLVGSALAIGALLTLGVFTVSPYVAFSAPVAALSVVLPLIIGSTVYSTIVIALSSAAISKNNTISEKDAKPAKKDSLVQAQKERAAEQKTRLVNKQEQSSKEEGNLNYLDLEIHSSKQEKHANSLDFLDLATSRNLNDLEDELYFDAQSQNTEVLNTENQPTEEGTKVNGYFNQAVSAVNWLAGQATKVISH